MPAVILNGYNSTGHACFPPTNVNATQIKTVKINGVVPAVIGDTYTPHTCGKVTHAGAARALIRGSNNVYIENIPACRIGDPISCGDFAGQGSVNVFAGG